MTMMERREAQSVVTQNSVPTKTSRGNLDPLDVSGIKLAGEDDDCVPVYDTCATIRRKISNFLSTQGITQTAFLRAISIATGDHRKLQGGQLKRYMAMKGPLAGNTNAVYYKSYVFFEKIRIRDKKGKSETRLEMERQHPDGMDTTRVRNHAWAPANSRVEVDKYGVIRIC